MNQAKIRIAIADDHAIVRKGLVQIIAELPELEVVAEAFNGNDLLKAIRKNEDLDLIIMDIGMPEKSGWETMGQIKVEWPHLPVLVLSVFPEEDYAIRFFKAGASGYLNKASAPELLVEAIKKVAHGGRFISSSLAEKLAFEMSGNSQKQLHEALSQREFQVFLLLASGKTVKEASRELALSIPTISTHRARILEKMEMKSNAQLTQYAFKTGLIS